MRKILFAVAIVFTTVTYARFVEDPLNALMSFVLAGTVPGTDLMLGLWPSLGLAIFFLWAAKKYLRHIRLLMLENTSKQITKEKLQKSFKQDHEVTFDKSKRSVVASSSSTSSI